MNIIAIYGNSCCLKTEVAQEVSRVTGFKVVNRGELATTRAKVAKLPTAHKVPLEQHNAIDAETREMAKRDEPLMIFESSFMDAVLKDVANVFFVRLTSRDEVREARWHKRKEEGGGRTRQLGESLAERDRLDAELRRRLYGAQESGVRPALDIDTSEQSAYDVAREILEAFNKAGTGVTVATSKPAMERGAARGIAPGPTKGKVRYYAAQQPPFGGYITDFKSGRDIFIHKSALKEGPVKDLAKDQEIEFDIVEDGFGGFKAVNVRQAA
ncbi:MAG TPA: cold shock domain-containing protein [Pelomicrobium sp.]|nr:cold shock domain-containing protein [Pelomicrobium sp.]